MLKLSHFFRLISRPFKSEPDPRFSFPTSKPEKFDQDCETCLHKDWSPEYDYSRGLGTVAFLESYCLGCGTPQHGGGQ